MSYEVKLEKTFKADDVGFIDDVIQPALLRGMQVQQPRRDHDNMPL